MQISVGMGGGGQMSRAAVRNGEGTNVRTRMSDERGVNFIRVSITSEAAQPAGTSTASEMTYIVSSGALNSTHSLTSTSNTRCT